MTRTALPLALLLALAPLGACQQPDVTSRGALVDRMLERYDAARGGVGGFVVTGGGGEATHGALPDSTADLAPPAIVPVGDAPPDPEVLALLAQQVPNVRLLARALRAATLDGPRDLRGRRVYVLTAEPEAPGAPTLHVVVDAETFDVREIEQAVTADTLDRPVLSRLIYDDFRTVDGLTVPFRVRQIREGVDQLIPMRDRMVRGGPLAVAKGQIDRLPPGPERERRRAEIERDLRLYTEGVQETELRVDRVRVVPAE
jgi:hypothetical protein